MLNRLCAWFHAFCDAIRVARNPPKPVVDPNHLEIFVRREDGPVVETKHAVLPISRVPQRSTKADAKRMALAYAQRRSGETSLSWKRARKLLNAWARDERNGPDDYYSYTETL